MKDLMQKFALTSQQTKSKILDYNGQDINYSSGEFDLCLCDHVLFDRTKDKSVGYHVDTIKRLCEVAKEVRIFPITADEQVVTSLVGPVMLNLQQQNFGVEIKPVGSDDNHGENTMMRIWPETCELK